MANTPIGYYSPSLAKRIRDNSFAWERERAAKPVEVQRTIPNPIYLQNASTTLTIPALGVVQMVGLEKIDGQTFIKVDRPFTYSNSVMGPFLINENSEIAPYGLGMAQFGPVYRAKATTGSFSVGTRMGPADSVYTLGKGPSFIYLGLDDADESVIKVERCETPLLAVAGGSGIAGNSSGTVTAKQPASGNWTAGSVTYTAWAPTSAAISANATVMIFPVDAKWVAVEIC